MEQRGHKSAMMQAYRRSSMASRGATAGVNAAASDASGSQFLQSTSENQTANFGRKHSRKMNDGGRKGSALGITASTPPAKMQEVFKKQGRFASQMRMTTKST